MTSFTSFWSQTDAVGRFVAYVLLAMSLTSWFLIFWKSGVLFGASRRFRRARDGFWQQGAVEDGHKSAQAVEAEGAAAVLVQAALGARGIEHGLAARKTLGDRLTAALRDTLIRISARLNFGQVLLASIGSTAPFVGLFGTVWGIYHALASISGAGQLNIEKVAGPVGEALIMTAAGLAVAIPAVLAYNIFGKVIHALETELEGFAHDVRALLVADSAQ
jgi:biopolymer transport protein ExbB